MSKIDVSPEDLKRWAKGLLELGVSVRTRLEQLADLAGKAELNRQKDDGFATHRGATPPQSHLHPAVLNFETTLSSFATAFDRYAQALTAALEGSASTVSTYDTKTGSGFADKTVLTDAHYRKYMVGK